jgi:antitoxin component YwqK of YwqJK toxin-antitoxin module
VKKLLLLVLVFIICTGFEQKDDIQTYYWPDGSTKYAEGPVVNGKRHGIWTEWHRNGKRSKTATYVRGIKDGNWIYWRDNGHVSAEMKYERGVLLSAKSYRPDGTVGSHIRNGSGKWMTWYKNGKKEQECEYVNGKLNGKLIMWYENGRKSSECEFLDNVPHGKHIYYWHEMEEVLTNKCRNLILWLQIFGMLGGPPGLPISPIGNALNFLLPLNHERISPYETFRNPWFSLLLVASAIFPIF